MDPRLLNASLRGDVNALLALTREDPLILHNVTVTASNTPLHVSALLGHVEFALLVMQYCPQFAGEVNQQGLTPIHLASVQGHWEIVKEMLIQQQDLAFVKDKDGNNFLHTAAIRGRVLVMREVFSTESVKEVTLSGETVLHLAVKHNQYQALETLIQLINQHQIGEELFNAKDVDGNTILHLACSRKESQIVRLLVSNQTNVDVNAVTSGGLTALDIAARLIAGPDENEMQEILQNAGAEISGAEISGPLEQHPVTNQQQLAGFAKVDKKYVDSLRNGIGVVAALFATQSFQFGMNPPGGTWQDWAPSTNLQNTTTHSTAAGNIHTPGKSIIWDIQNYESRSFLQWTASCLFSSLAILVVLAMTERLNYNKQAAWVRLLYALFGYALYSAAAEFISGMALVTGISTVYILLDICSQAWMMILFSFLYAFIMMRHDVPSAPRRQSR